MKDRLPQEINTAMSEKSGAVITQGLPADTGNGKIPAGPPLFIT